MKQIIRNIKIKILSFLVHHANRLGKDEDFYNIKTMLLNKYGVSTGYDVQFIEGKKCYSCGGTGIFIHISGDEDECYNCINGWYKLPVWNILLKVRFGKYFFHKPWVRVHKKPVIYLPVFEGYINHIPTKYSKLCKLILFLIFEKKYFKKYWKDYGRGWRLRWWLPRNYLHNFIHILKYKHKAFPFRKKKKNSLMITYGKFFNEIDDLPF